MKGGTTRGAGAATELREVVLLDDGLRLESPADVIGGCAHDTVERESPGLAGTGGEAPLCVVERLVIGEWVRRFPHIGYAGGGGEGNEAVGRFGGVRAGVERRSVRDRVD